MPANTIMGVSMGEIKTNMIEEGIAILAEREIKFADRFIPYFLASYGAHHFNLHNRNTRAYRAFGRVPDTRLQILFTAPPGWSKSMFLKQLLHPEFGILNNSSIPMRFAGSVTEAGWTGSSDGGSGSLVSVLGMAEKFKNGIVGMEEFAALNAIMEQQHSSHLEQALAMSLFEGDVEKDLKGVTISYHTDVTLWAGNQIMNFNLSGGLFRRFFHVYWTPRLSEAEVLSKAVWLGDDRPPNRPRMLNYRAELLGISPRIHNIQEIEFTDRFKAAIAGVPHFEKSLYKSFGIGYTIMSDTNIPQKLIVDADPHMRELLDVAIMWRKQLLADPRGFQVESLLYDLEADTFPVEWSRVRELNLMFSVSYFDTDEIIRNLLRAGRVKYNSHDKTLKLA